MMDSQLLMRSNEESQGADDEWCFSGLNWIGIHCPESRQSCRGIVLYGVTKKWSWKKMFDETLVWVPGRYDECSAG